MNSGFAVAVYLLITMVLVSVGFGIIYDDSFFLLIATLLTIATVLLALEIKEMLNNPFRYEIK